MQVSTLCFCKGVQVTFYQLQHPSAISFLNFFRLLRLLRSWPCFSALRCCLALCLMLVRGAFLLFLSLSLRYATATATRRANTRTMAATPTRVSLLALYRAYHSAVCSGCLQSAVPSNSNLSQSARYRELRPDTRRVHDQTDTKKRRAAVEAIKGGKLEY